MTEYEMSWHESHYMEVEADSREDAEAMLDKLATTRSEHVTTYSGIVDDIYIWEVKPDIEVSNPVANENKWSMDRYEVLEDDLSEWIE